jgi:hypothetical protein
MTISSLSEADHGKLKDTLHAMAALLIRSRNTEKSSAVFDKPDGSETGAGEQAAGKKRHAKELAARPAEWMPWNYRETLARIAPLPSPAFLSSGIGWVSTTAAPVASMLASKGILQRRGRFRWMACRPTSYGKAAILNI